MPEDTDFTTVVKLKLSELVDGVPTQSAGSAALMKYVQAVREVALNKGNPAIRRGLLAQVDQQLYDDLDALSDTEHVEQPGQEQPGEEQARDGQEQPGPAAPVVDLPEIPPSEPPLPEIPEYVPQSPVSQKRRKRN